MAKTKAVKPKGLSPSVPDDAKTTHKYSTGGAGRATPCNYGKKNKTRSNP